MDARILAEEIAHGYRCAGAAINLGSIVVDRTTFPHAGPVRIPLRTLNRHGLVTGATGTGKTKTLQSIAEQLSDAGVPVVLADIKGDLSGLAQPANRDMTDRAADAGMPEWTPCAYPTEFLSLGTGGAGVPIRATVESFGPILLARALNLNETQESTLSLIFHWARKTRTRLSTLADLDRLIRYLLSPDGKNAMRDLAAVSSASAAVILRAVINLSDVGGNTFFGTPELNPDDFMNVTRDGLGTINLIELKNLIKDQKLLSVFLVWILSWLFDNLPELGDADKPRLVFIFDESHLLFDNASKAFLEHIETTVRLIRSKGVSILFCTQLATDIPNKILAQLGVRIQHAVRAFTAEDQTALAKTVKTFPISKAYQLSHLLTALDIGEAAVTVLSETGAPAPVAWTRLQPPRSLMGSIGADTITSHARQSPLWNKYAHQQPPTSAQPHPPNPPVTPGWFFPPAAYLRATAPAAPAWLTTTQKTVAYSIMLAMLAWRGGCNSLLRLARSERHRNRPSIMVVKATAWRIATTAATLITDQIAARQHCIFVHIQDGAVVWFDERRPDHPVQSYWFHPATRGYRQFGCGETGRTLMARLHHQHGIINVTRTQRRHLH